MSATTEFTAGDYDYIPSVFQYSAGVRGKRGFRSNACDFRSRCHSKRDFAYCGLHQGPGPAAYRLPRM